MLINNVILSGRLGNDAETKEVNGKMLTNFRMAVYQGKGKDSMWLQVSAWDKTAEFCRGITKGCEVIVEGGLSCREYTNKEGATKTSIELRATRVHQLAKIEHKDPEDVAF